MEKTLDIALLVKTDADYHRSLLTGAAQYAEDAGGWRFSIPPVDANGDVFLPPDWDGDGVICEITSESLEASIVARGIPAVNVAWTNSSTGMIPGVHSDPCGCASLAVKFLIEKQYAQYGFVGFSPNTKYSQTIENEVAGELGARGHELHRFEVGSVAGQTQGFDPAKCVEWLHGIPKPLALIVGDRLIASQVIDTCAAAAIDVPGSVAVLAIEHDSLWSSLARVSISNVDQDPWRVGFHAAKVLHEMINGGVPPQDPVLVPPIAIVQRKSTEAATVIDPVLDKAIKFIYQNAETGIAVKDILDHVSISRRGLETRFRQDLNCSPAAFIRRIQLQSVARLLRTTKLTISAISQRTGFAYPEVLMRSFKREFGVTPMQFRGSGSAQTTGQPDVDRASGSQQDAVSL